MKRMAIFKYNASKCGWKEKGGGECFDSAMAEREINVYLDSNDADLVDIKVNTYTYDRHNNGGADGVEIVYTVIYEI